MRHKERIEYRYFPVFTFLLVLRSYVCLPDIRGLQGGTNGMSGNEIARVLKNQSSAFSRLLKAALNYRRSGLSGNGFDQHAVRKPGTWDR